MAMERLQLHLPLQQMTALRDIQKETGLSVAELIRQAIQHWLTTRQTPPPKKDQYDRRFTEL